ncbi:MAG: DUF3656 domain-containing protein, partial [Muribaculaceae bacterium]|nr:DUF3656 domain-containing protein [Muribaculaceae bacterium]
LDDSGLTVSDERGCMVRIPNECKRDEAKRPQDYTSIFAKLGNTPYRLNSFSSEIDPSVFIPAGELTELRRRAILALDEANLTTYPLHYRIPENKDSRYFSETLDYRDNVANSLAEIFYRDHGVRNIEYAIETKKSALRKGTRVMTTRHCILRELGMCKKGKGLGRYSEPLALQSGKDAFTLEFNCQDCEMHLLTRC